MKPKNKPETFFAYKQRQLARCAVNHLDQSKTDTYICEGFNPYVQVSYNSNYKWFVEDVVKFILGKAVKKKNNVNVNVVFEIPPKLSKNIVIAHPKAYVNKNLTSDEQQTLEDTLRSEFNKKIDEGELK